MSDGRDFFGYARGIFILLTKNLKYKYFLKSKILLTIKTTAWNKVDIAMFCSN